MYKILTVIITILFVFGPTLVASFAVSSSRPLASLAEVSYVSVPHHTKRCPIITTDKAIFRKTNPTVCLSASDNNNNNNNGDDADGETQMAALPATTTAAAAASVDKSSGVSSAMNDNDVNSISNIDPSASTAVMISQNQKRILIEELGYRRKDVDKMRFELAAPIIDKRIRCPEGGMPDEWCRSEQEISKMKQQLLDESKYPLKLPLLAISLILFGKGFGDALITLIKVNIDFPGASLTEQFMGVPVLAIDALCVALGAALGAWTWDTMRDKQQ